VKEYIKGQKSGAVSERNNNPMFPRVIREESLKDLTGWKKRKTNKGKWQYIDP